MKYQYLLSAYILEMVVQKPPNKMVTEFWLSKLSRQEFYAAMATDDFYGNMQGKFETVFPTKVCKQTFVKNSTEFAC